MEPNAGALASARRVVLSVGLGFWGLGAAVSVWLAVRSVQLDAADAVLALTMSGLMLAGFVTEVGWTSGWGTRRHHHLDPVARAWWLLTVYPVFPAITASFVLRDAGVLSWDERNLVNLAFLACVLFVRGLVLLSPVGLRVVAADTRCSIRDGPLALPTGAGVAYLVTAAGTFVAAAAAWWWVSLTTAALGFVAIQAGTAVVARRAEAVPEADDREVAGPAAEHSASTSTARTDASAEPPRR